MLNLAEMGCACKARACAADGLSEHFVSIDLNTALV